MNRLGGWLFRQRTWLPLPLALALAFLPPQAGLPRSLSFLLGALIVAAGEAVRLWAVHHIGVISRTRSNRLGPLVATGPFAFVRNPLYLGNILLWLGFAVSARLLWLAPIVVALLAFEYSAIVLWEEGLLTERLGDDYRDYVARVPRWIPSMPARSAEAVAAPGFSWNATLFSERGTIIAIAVGYVLLYFK